MNTQTANKSLENVTKFKYSYFDTTQTSESCKHEKIKNRQKLRNACYHSVQKLLSSYLTSKNVKKEIHKT
jgi:hypothetical protein